MAGAGEFPKSGGSDVVYKVDYNSIQTAVSAVKTTYYGVACTSSQLPSGQVIARTTEWNYLKIDLDDCYTHITGSDSGISNKTSTTPIRADYTTGYKTAADYIEANKTSVYASTQLTLVSAAASTRTSGWNTAITHQIRVTFSSASDATYFFQCAGYFRIQTAASGGSGGTKNTNWATVINAVSDWRYSLADYNSGNKSNTYTVSAYSSSSLTISCAKESNTSLLFTMYFNDATGGSPDETIDLSISSDLSYYKSTGGITSPYPSGIATVTDLNGGSGIAVPTYSFDFQPTSIDEGGNGTFTFNTTNVNNGTTLYWTVSSNAGDFTTASGSFTINSNAGSFTVYPTADTTTEGSETFIVVVRTVSITGSVVATSNSVTINDTSTTPTPTYSFGTIPTSINEGSAGTINVNTTNVSNGTTLYWTVTNAGDFGTSSGSFTVNSNAGSFTVTPTADTTTEGAETFTVSIRTGSTSGSIVATSGTITINDTSTTPPSATAAILTNYIDSTYNAGLGASFASAWTDITFLSTGTLRTTIGDAGAPEVRSILPGEWLTTSPAAVSTTTAGLFDIELTPDATTLAMEGTITTYNIGLNGNYERTSTGTSWNTRIQLGTTEVFRYLYVEQSTTLGGSFNVTETNNFTATIYLHGTNTVQTSTAITMFVSAGTTEL